MKKSALLLGILCLVSCVAVSTVRAEDKFGYVDLTRIFSEYSKTKEFDKVLSEKGTAYESEREKKVTELKQLQDKMNLLSDKEKEGKKGEFDSKVKSLQEYDRQKQTDFKEENDKMRRSRILKKRAQYVGRKGIHRIQRPRVGVPE